MMKKKITRYLKGYPKFTYFMSNESVCFMIHLQDIEFLRKGGYNTTWPVEQYIARTGLSQSDFYRCTWELTRLGLLVTERSECKKFVSYALNQKGYNRLLEVCGATYDCDRTKSLLKEVKAKGRFAENITDNEITSLKGFSRESTREASYVRVYPGFSYFLTANEICLLMHIADIEFLMRFKTYSFWTKKEWLDKTNMEEAVFDKAVRNLKYWRIINEPDKTDDRVVYKINYRVFDKLVDICGATCNYNALKEFFTWLTIKEKRAILSVREKELEALAHYGNHYGGMQFPFPVLPKYEFIRP